jgi:hypothetical protein
LPADGQSAGDCEYHGLIDALSQARPPNIEGLQVALNGKAATTFLFVLSREHGKISGHVRVFKTTILAYIHEISLREL